MAEGRMLKRSIATSEQLERVSFEADYLFARCIPFLDVEGRMPGAAGRVRALVCPLRPEMTPEVVARCLQELHDVGLVVWYDTPIGRALAFPGFHRHNTVRREREGSSKLPPPDGATPGVLPDHSRSTPALSKGSGEEANTSETNIQPPVRAHDAREAAAPVAPEAAAVLRSAPLKALVSRLLKTHYAAAPPERRESVIAQLEAALSADGVRHRGETVRATPEVLARAIRDTLGEKVRIPDRAIVIVLRKCSSGNAVEPPDAAGRLPSEAVAARERDERGADERERQARDHAAAEWLDAHPDECAAIEARVLRELPPLDGPSERTSTWLAIARTQRRTQLVEERQAALGELAGAVA